MNAALPPRRRTLVLFLVAVLAPLASAEPPAKGQGPAVEKAVKKPARRPAQVKRNRRARRSRAKRSKGTRRQRWPLARPKTLPADFGIPKLGQIPFPEGERLVFSVQMLGAEAGEVMLGVGMKRKNGDGRWVLPFAGWIRSSDFLTRFYPVKDHLRVELDLKTFLPTRSDFFIREKSKVVDYHTVFNQTGRLITSRKVKSHREDKPLHRNFTPTGPMIDTLTAVYAARRLELVPGKTFSFYVWDGRKERLVKVKMARVEKVWTAIGWFDAMRLDVTTRVTGGFIQPKVLKWKPMQGHAWIGLDPHRTPIKLVSPTKLGDATALLKRRFVESTDLGAQARMEGEASK